MQNDLLRKMLVEPGTKVSLKNDYDPSLIPDGLDKEKAKEQLQKGVERLAEYQDKLFAQDRYSMLVIFQALDAAGKDGTIKHVMSGINPQGCEVHSFRQPSAEDLDHDYMWRCMKVLPPRGKIGIFNRSYYEEVLVVRVHPEFLAKQKLPGKINLAKIWKQRYEEINNFEKYLSNNGVIILKFFLNVSKKEQKKRFLSRIDEPEKNWKFSAQDVVERQFWTKYQQAYDECLSNTSTSWAPWYVIPADNKPFTRVAVAEIITDRLKQLDLHYPEISADDRQKLLRAMQLLLSGNN